VQPTPQNPGDDDDQQQGQGQGQGNFQDFFNRFFGGQAPDQEGGDDGTVHRSLGSGFIVDPQGLHHHQQPRVEKADKIYVKLSTDPDSQDLGRPARVIGVDKATDLAVIRSTPTSRLPTVKLGNSDTAQGRRLGRGYRQPLRAVADGDGGNYFRQETGPSNRAWPGSFSTSSRPTRPSIRATRAGRC